MCYHMRAWCRYTRGRFESTHGGFLDGHTGEREERRERRGGSPSVLLTKKSPRRVLTWPHKFTERNPWILYIFSLRIDREQLVPESSNHSLYLMNLFIFSNLEESAHNRHKHQHKDTHTQHTQHTHTHQHIPTDPPTHNHSSSLLLSSPSHTHTQTHMYMSVYLCMCVYMHM